MDHVSSEQFCWINYNYVIICCITTLHYAKDYWILLLYYICTYIYISISLSVYINIAIDRASRHCPTSEIPAQLGKQNARLEVMSGLRLHIRIVRHDPDT